MPQGRYESNPGLSAGQKGQNRRHAIKRCGIFRALLILCYGVLGGTCMPGLDCDSEAGLLKFLVDVLTNTTYWV